MFINRKPGGCLLKPSILVIENFWETSGSWKIPAARISTQKIRQATKRFQAIATAKD